MQFVDHASIYLQAGKGGQGAVSFRREKYVAKGGPDGGHGGNGGHIILIASSKLQSLMDYKLSSRYKAKDGKPGQGKDKAGATGNDLVLPLPVGTMIFDENDNLLADLCVPNQTFIAVHGGKGGRGNASFSSSINRTPYHAQPGLPGEERSLTIELRLIAQVGLIGLPNAGKSTLLKALTNANPKIANYPFTTLSPNLGRLVYDDQEITIADVPGLIEKASEGVGLGLDFLRHISRTSLLVHLISVESAPEQCLLDYNMVCLELSKSPYHVHKNPTLVVLSKIDIIDDKILNETIDLFEQEKISVLTISAITKKGISDLIKMMIHNLNTLTSTDN